MTPCMSPLPHDSPLIEKPGLGQIQEESEGAGFKAPPGKGLTICKARTFPFHPPVLTSVPHYLSKSMSHGIPCSLVSHDSRGRSSLPRLRVHWLVRALSSSDTKYRQALYIFQIPLYQPRGRLRPLLLLKKRRKT